MKLLDPDVLEDAAHYKEWQPHEMKRKRLLASDPRPYDDRIREGYEKGEPTKEIAKAAGIPRGTVIGRAFTLGLTHPNARQGVSLPRDPKTGKPLGWKGTKAYKSGIPSPFHIWRERGGKQPGRYGRKKQ